MSNNNEDKIIEGHEYDGIKEYDNPLPGWWLLTFFGTIVFSFLYYIHYTFTEAPDLMGEYKIAMVEIEKMKSSGSSQASVPSDLEEQFKDSNVSVAGKAIFDGKCAACHGPQGGGLVGPNLTDKFWIHGKATANDIYTVIANGVTEKGMPAWKDMVKPQELIQVSAYIYSIKDKNVPGGKAAQGNEIK